MATNIDSYFLPEGSIEPMQTQEPNARRTLYMCFADLGGQNVKDQLKKKGAISQIKSD